MDFANYAAERAEERFKKTEERTIRDQGFAASKQALGITKAFIPQLSAYIRTELLKPRGTDATYSDERVQGLLSVIRQLDPDVIALAAIGTGLTSIAKEAPFRDSCILIGRTLYGECWANKLLQHDGKLAAKIERAARKRHGNVKYRKQAARSAAARAGFRMSTWGRELEALAGSVLVTWLLDAIPEVFVLDETDPQDKRLAVTEGAEALAMAAVAEAVKSRPYYLPCDEPPLPWTGWKNGGYPKGSHRLVEQIWRTHHKEAAAAAKAAIKDGSMQPFLDALNSLQDVAWTINKPVLEVFKACAERGIPVKGLPHATDLPLPERSADWEDMDEAAQKLWKLRASEIRTTNRGLVSERVQLKEDLSTATLLSAQDAFWTPCNCDWRGRVYPMPHFNFQRDDRVRALFLFRDGIPIGEDGLWWLKVHVANTGDFNKISKRPLEERVTWVEQNSERIQSVAASPLTDLWWTEADKPFLFLSACMELNSAIAIGQNYITHLPVSFDGSCSGLQHLSAMTRAPEGSLVNLTASPEPQDVYRTVAEVAKARIARDFDTEDGEYARMCLAYGVDRSLVKRNVMTFSYSSKRFGMAQQHIEDTMAPLRFKVLTKAIEEHPFTDNEKTQGAAARYLAGHVYSAIESVVELPAKAMGFLQKCALALAHEGKPLSWVTPTGMPWCNRYHEVNTKRVSLWLHDTRIQMKIATGNNKEIDKDKVRNGVAPNFVHALDAAHLMLTANAAAREGIQSATVHDSFGCLAPHARRFNAIIREEFVRMYETHDVLAEVLASASRDLTPANSHRLPEGLEYGSLDIRQVLASDFAFA